MLWIRERALLQVKQMRLFCLSLTRETELLKASSLAGCLKVPLDCTPRLSTPALPSLSVFNQIKMQFYLSALFLCLLPSVIAVPFADPDATSSLPQLFDREATSTELATRDPAKSPDKNGNQGKKEDCQKPIAQNLCTSGSPYCCSGTGDQQVCGPAGSVSCQAMTICCINTNGMQICAGEIDFTGPVTININYGKVT
ncbi:hypothetical protein C7974DRAFT_18562 [Boeremia exigua]|uniref:uncharacterized protein n=1 Tax=Boeremia exigua TaxID=749465 RepID=UPI001E8E78D5|nr:uncharacterized protein C7974DRAFT_18562 [Boeremia exigua]KAH6644321.1 hypothetical protein C7974DRAFT_18562 [Boeremia exigua]